MYIIKYFNVGFQNGRKINLPSNIFITIQCVDQSQYKKYLLKYKNTPLSPN